MLCGERLSLHFSRENYRLSFKIVIVLAPIQMVDLKGQYQRIQAEIDAAVLSVCASAAFIHGPEVKAFERELANYLQVRHVIGCANGTDALQIALMALGLQPSDEVIVPDFTYIATVEVAALLGLRFVPVDILPDFWTIDAEAVRKAITPKTRAVVPVHLFGQCADMEPLMALAEEYGFFVIEDNAQSIGAAYANSDDDRKIAGGIGHIGTTSFYPSKNLSCFGDGGAIFTNDEILAEKIRMIANHGQKTRYIFEAVGVNSRLDSIQAAVLRIKLGHLNEYIEKRRAAAAFYDERLATVEAIRTPQRAPYSTHVFHQYTIQVPPERREALCRRLEDKKIPHAIFYPLGVHEQPAYRSDEFLPEMFPNSLAAARSVLSLPMHTELTDEQLNYICDAIIEFFA